MKAAPLYNAHEFASLFQQGDETALSFFYHEFLPALSLYSLKWVAERGIAEEIAVQAFTKTWKMRGKLDSYGAIRAYLYKIVQRDSIAYVRNENRRSVFHCQLSSSDTDSDTPLDHLVRTETYRLIHTALKGLPAASRQVIVMHYLDGKSTGQIARELQLHPSTIKTQKARGLKALRSILLRPVSFLVFLFL